jgi:hypothetical protein
MGHGLNSLDAQYLLQGLVCGTRISFSAEHSRGFLQQGIIKHEIARFM